VSTIGQGPTGGTTVINGSGLNPRGNQTKQQTYFQQFYGYWANRTLFTIQTPWAIFQDMAIQTLRAVQDADTRVITDFEVTFKLMRFASTQVVFEGEGVQYDNNNFDGRASDQGSKEKDLGSNALETSPSSFSDNYSAMA
jgi:hypothetical protein